MPFSIATRTGDRGITGLVFGQRVSKNHPRVEAVGRFDELNVAVGFAKATANALALTTPGQSSPLPGILEALQHDLVPLMGELAADDGDQERYLESNFGHLGTESLARVDASIARLESLDPPLKFDGWATPGGTPLAAALDLARVAARRAERQLVALRDAGSPVRDLVLQFVNRVSDMLWLLARQAEQLG